MYAHDDGSERRLRAALEEARRMAPYRAPVVAVPSTRTLHRAEAVQGEVLPLVLASPTFAHAQFGAYAWMENPWVLAINGVLRGEHLPDLLPWLEQAVAKGAQIVIAAADYDVSMLATLVINRQRETVGIAALAAADPGDGAALRRLAELAQVAPATVDGARLQVSALGSVPALLMTTHDTVAVGGAGAQPVALVHTGGETLDQARAAAAALRSML